MVRLIQLLVVISRTDRNTVSTQPKGVSMKRRPMSRKGSKIHFKKNTGVQKMNSLNPRTMRGGIRL